MRNYYFPQRLADYVSENEIRAMRRNRVVVERDYEFGAQKKSEEEDTGTETTNNTTTSIRPSVSRVPEPVSVDLDLLEVNGREHHGCGPYP